jgi:hypothetical protein
MLEPEHLFKLIEIEEGPLSTESVFGAPFRVHITPNPHPEKKNPPPQHTTKPQPNLVIVPSAARATKS